MKNILKATALAAGLACAATTASAHLVTIGWKDNGNGTVSLFGEHWHGDQTTASTANGGLTVTGPSSSFTAQWLNVINNRDRVDMVNDGTLTGWDAGTGNSGSGTHDDWFSTKPLVLGNGTWSFFTGTSCCIDTMQQPVSITLTGITSVTPGTGPGQPGSVIPLPAGLPLLAGGLGLLDLVGIRRRKTR